MPDYSELMRNMETIIHLQRKSETVLMDLQNDNTHQLVLRDEKNGTEIIMQEEVVKLYSKELLQYEVLAGLTLENNGSEDEAKN